MGKSVDEMVDELYGDELHSLDRKGLLFAKMEDGKRKFHEILQCKTCNKVIIDRINFYEKED